ncbi:unannotated protein [freshwater metagenome]|uniref:Unannotated protein n=1 Tax=freshwater metagenome TaxID=449393 RepID=A0A6J7ASY8_9ZZZZ
MIAQVADRVVDEVLGQVVAVCDRSRRVDVFVAAHELGMELVGLAAQEAVEAVEPSGQRPVVERPGGGALVARREMPLAHHEGREAVRTQHLGDGGRRRGDGAPHVRKARVEVRDAAHAHRVMVSAGEEAGPGRRAHGRDMEVVVAESAGGESIDVGRLDGRPVAAEVPVPRVVEQDHDCVRRAGCGHGERWPVRCRLGDSAADRAAERFCVHDPPGCRPPTFVTVRRRHRRSHRSLWVTATSCCDR